MPDPPLSGLTDEALLVLRDALEAESGRLLARIDLIDVDTAQKLSVVTGESLWLLLDITIAIAGLAGADATSGWALIATMYGFFKLFRDGKLLISDAILPLLRLRRCARKLRLEVNRIDIDATAVVDEWYQRLARRNAPTLAPPDL